MGGRGGTEPRGAAMGPGSVGGGGGGDRQRFLLLDGLQLGALHRLRDERQLLAQRLEAIPNADVGDVGAPDVVPFRPLFQVVGAQPVALHLGAERSRGMQGGDVQLPGGSLVGGVVVPYGRSRS